MKLKQLIADFVMKRSDSALLWQVFAEHSRLSGLALRNFERALDARGIRMSDHVMSQAKAAAMVDRRLTVGDFLDHRFKRERSSRLSWGSR